MTLNAATPMKMKVNLFHTSGRSLTLRTIPSGLGNTNTMMSCRKCSWAVILSQVLNCTGLHDMILHLSLLWLQLPLLRDILERELHQWLLPSCKYILTFIAQNINMPHTSCWSNLNFQLLIELCFALVNINSFTAINDKELKQFFKIKLNLCYCTLNYF